MDSFPKMHLDSYPIWFLRASFHFKVDMTWLRRSRYCFLFSDKLHMHRERVMCVHMSG